jgi:hypothetical protein
MDLRRLLHPRTIAVVGATDRHDSYAGRAPGDAFDQKVERVASGVPYCEGRGSARRARARAGAGAAGAAQRRR